MAHPAFDISSLPGRGGRLIGLSECDGRLCELGGQGRARRASAVKRGAWYSGGTHFALPQGFARLPLNLFGMPRLTALLVAV